MKAATFENLIRKVVREEIDYSLRREIKSLKEDLRDELKPTIVEHTGGVVENTTPTTTKSTLRDQIMGKSPLIQKPNLNYTSNGTLNDLLNETAMGDTNTQVGNASANISQPFATGAPLPTDSEGLPPEVASAITRDYSGLMKAINKKKGK